MTNKDRSEKWKSILKKMAAQSGEELPDEIEESQTPLQENIDRLIELRLLPEKYIVDGEIKETLDEIEKGTPVIHLAGRAGTGKSTLVDLIRNTTKKRHVVLASTGIAALNVSGQTIHSFFRLPPKLISFTDIKMRHDEIIKQLQLIIIDEVSMVRSDVITAIDSCLKLWRSNNKPFGGVQMLIVGDCCQLPPVVTTYEKDMFDKYYKSPWFFDSKMFDKVQIKICMLKNIYRQNDEMFIELLNNIRTGTNIKETVDTFNSLCYDKGKSSSIYLTTTNRQADSVNEFMIEDIDEEEHTYTGIIKGDLKLTGDRLPVPQELVLKVDARVMIKKNIEGAVNGSLGYVKECGSDYIIVELDAGYDVTVERVSWKRYAYDYNSKTKEIESKELGEYLQYPVILGWACTIHRSQGMTLDNVELDLSGGAFVAGQLYVALSRCRTLEGLSLSRKIRYGDVMVEPIVQEFYKNEL